MFCNLRSISDGDSHIPPAMPQQLNIRTYWLFDASKHVRGHERDLATSSKRRRARKICETRRIPYAFACYHVLEAVSVLDVEFRVPVYHQRV